jgi:serine/threonine protein kinase
MKGGSLHSKLIKNGPLKEILIQTYAIKLLNALSYLHDEMNICHRDIKCANILIDDKDNIKLADFGCSK